MVCGAAHDPICQAAGAVPSMGGQPGSMGYDRLCGYVHAAGGGGHHPRGASGNLRRVCLRRCVGQRFMYAGPIFGQCHCVCPGTQAGSAYGGDLLPPGKAGKAAFSQAFSQAELSVLADLHRAGHTQGSAVLFRGADGRQLGHLAAAVLRGPAAVGADIHRGRQRLGRQELPVCGPCLWRNTAFIPGGATDLPLRMPAP